MDLNLNQPIITVVLPVYNVAAYIQECLDSIFNQTFQDFEILVIDDCSTDNTVQVIESLASERITIVKKAQNKGLIDSLNIGFSLAKGKYIARVDGDDINALDRFEKQFNYLENHPEIAACGCWLHAFGFSSRVIKHPEFHNRIKAQMLISNAMSLGATMLRRKSYENSFFYSTMWHAEDYDYWVRTMDFASLHNLQEVLYYYRTHEQQVSTSFKSIQIEKDVEIKLNLWKRILYDTERYSDEFVIRMILTKDSFTLKDYYTLKGWFKNVLKSNKSSKVFVQDELKMVVNYIKHQFLNEIFFLSKRIKTNKKERLMFYLLVLTFSEKLYILKRKFKWN